VVKIPRLLIAGTQSGVGKTTVAVGIMAALVKRGLTVQPFKVGPDYIDPTYHTSVAKRPSRNLDTWLLKDKSILAVFQKACSGADCAVMEGVMGLFDGHSEFGDRGSTAETAKLLRAPVVLVVDASHMARSAAAMVQGYAGFDPSVRIAGVIFNKVSQRHFELLRGALRRYSRIPVLGHLPPLPGMAIPERHLGLLPAQENQTLLRGWDRLAQMVAGSIDLDRLLRISKKAPALPEARLPGPARSKRAAKVRIGVARDKAFHFYYLENFDLLKELGAELVEFSPLKDQRLPEKLDALYVGGGFPEVFASELARNRSIQDAMKHVVRQGIPTYAECGGLMYLCEKLVDGQGRSHRMVGVLPGAVRMTSRLQNFGYATVIPKRDNILAKANDPIKGHEFHYSVWDHRVPAKQSAYTVIKRREGTRSEGFIRENLLASYIHLHFLTNVRWARGFVASAQRWRERRTAAGGKVGQLRSRSIMGSLLKAGAAPQL